MRFGKISLTHQIYQSFITKFSHSLISADFVKDVKTVFNTALPTSIPITSKKGDKDSFSATMSLDRKSLEHSINHQGTILSGLFENQCQMPNCQTEDHILDIHISLNKSESDFSVNVRPRKKDASIHKGKMLHFYLLALNSKSEAAQLISLKLLSKSEVLQSVKCFQRFKLCIIYSKR